jgi:hypothetical protein
MSCFGWGILWFLSDALEKCWIRNLKYAMTASINIIFHVKWNKNQLYGLPVCKITSTLFCIHVQIFTFLIYLTSLVNDTSHSPSKSFRLHFFLTPTDIYFQLVESFWLTFSGFMPDHDWKQSFFFSQYTLMCMLANIKVAHWLVHICSNLETGNVIYKKALLEGVI